MAATTSKRRSSNSTTATCSGCSPRPNWVSAPTWSMHVLSRPGTAMTGPFQPAGCLLGAPCVRPPPVLMPTVAVAATHGPRTASVAHPSQLLIVEMLRQSVEFALTARVRVVNRSGLDRMPVMIPPPHDHIERLGHQRGRLRGHCCPADDHRCRGSGSRAKKAPRVVRGESAIGALIDIDRRYLAAPSDSSCWDRCSWARRRSAANSVSPRMVPTMAVSIIRSRVGSPRTRPISVVAIDSVAAA